MADPPGALGKLADACIHCGLCLDACPTYADLGVEPASPRGRIYFMRALVEGRLAAGPDVTRHLDSCLGCRACETACPSGVKYGRLLEGVRASFVEPARPPGIRGTLWRWLLRRVLPDRRRLRLATAPLRLLARGDRQWLPASLRRQVALFAPERVHAPLPPFTPAATRPVRGRAGFLAGCAMPVLYPGANSASVRLLASVGFDVVVPDGAGCCGALQAHDGDAAGAAVQADRTMRAFEGCEMVVTNAAGCGAALKSYPPAFAARVRDLSEALVEADWRPCGRSAGSQVLVAYHDPCHLSHGQGVRSAPRELLRRCGVRIAEVAEADYCCGGAGSYVLLQPALSDRLMERKVAHVLAVRPDLVVTANPSCLMQLRRGLEASGSDLAVLHLAEFLARYAT